MVLARVGGASAHGQMGLGFLWTRGSPLGPWVQATPGLLVGATSCDHGSILPPLVTYPATICRKAMSQHRKHLGLSQLGVWGEQVGVQEDSGGWVSR